MTCHHPIIAYRSREGKNENGKWPVVFNPAQGYRDKVLKVPCGKCVGCRLDRAKDWAGRCVHESRLWDSNLFITLTYNDKHLPKNYSLEPRDLQLFWKRLRKWVFSPNGLGRVPEYEVVDGKKIVVNGVRYYAAGEYGEHTGRPHYHAIVFNLELPDLVPVGIGRDGHIVYKSAILERLWSVPRKVLLDGKKDVIYDPIGHVGIGTVTFESAGYVARYVMKKIYGPDAPAHYGLRVPEFSRSSNRPGIGANWFIEFADEVARNGFVLINGHKNPVPRYYLKRMEKTNYENYLTYKKNRDIIVLRNKGSPDKTDERLADREKVLLHRISQLKRQG